MCSAPDVSAVAVAIPVTAAVGGRKTPPGLPLPSWPKSFHPQHRTVASGRSPQVNSAPGERAAGVIPGTVTGVEEALMAAGSPSCKKSFQPQHLMVPS